MKGRARRQDRRDDRGPDQGASGGANRYQMREKLASFGDDFWIQNSAGQRVFKVDGKAVRVRDTLNFEDAHRNVLCKIQERKLRLRTAWK